MSDFVKKLKTFSTKHAWLLLGQSKVYYEIGCGRAKLAPPGRGHLYYLMFITELLPVWPVGHMDSHITDWVTKPSQVPWLETYQFKCDPFTYKAIRNILCCMRQIVRGMGRNFWRTCKREKVISK